MTDHPSHPAGETPASPDAAAIDVAGILDLFEELVYLGEITPAGHYVHHAVGPKNERFLGGHVPDGAEPGRVWESRIHPEDLEPYAQFNRCLLRGEDAEVTYRLIGLDGVTRLLWDRARPQRRSDGGIVVAGIISDVTTRQAADARLAEVQDRFTRLLEVTGEHVYAALAHPDGRIEELFQGPGADRLLGGAVPDAEMTNWEAALHPEDRAAYEAFNAELAAGSPSEVEYRLIGADGITRWVHDRAATRRLSGGRVEISGIVSDVTERRRMRAELADAHAALSRVVEAMDDHLYTLRVDPGEAPRAVYRGPNRESLFGGELTGGPEDERTWVALIHGQDRARWEAAVARLPLGEPIEIEYRVIGLDGRERTVLDSLRPRRGVGGTIFYDGVTRDITERRRLEDELHHAHRAAERRARTDELTGVFNRRHFGEIVARALAADPDGCALLLLDADHFKQVNDRHGHVVGDAVLVELARRLTDGLRPADCLARWGGEEFAVLLQGVSSDAELDRLAQRLRTMVASTPVAVAGASIRLTISIGAARAGGQLTTLDALVDSADGCLYAAKRQGRDRVSLVPDIDADDRGADPDAVRLARALAMTAARREGAPEVHAEQVADLATRTAQHLDLPLDVVERCTLGGWLHDVGKVAVPDHILDKPGDLDDAEWSVMRTHPIVGADIVSRVELLQEAATAVRQHHERFDGAGYPDGLAGAAITIEARIVAAADAYAAMTSDRGYSSARTPGEAAAELRRSAGSHLDPAVVAALCDVLGFGERATLRVVA